MPDDPLDTAVPPIVPPSGREPREIVCQGCGCKLARNGDVLAVGEQHKKNLKHEDTLEKKDAEIARLQGELGEVKRQLDELKGSGSGASKTHRPGSRVA